MKVNRKTLIPLISYNPKTGSVTWKKRYPKSNELKHTMPVNTWNTRFYGKSVGFINDGGYLVCSMLGNRWRVHRLIWILINDREPEQIDHVNGNRTDNRLINLRDVKNKDNGRNQKIRITNTSGVTGVTWHKAGRKWHSQITVDGKNISLGLNSSFFDACCARKSAERRFGFHINHGNR